MFYGVARQARRQARPTGGCISRYPGVVFESMKGGGGV